MKQRLGNRIFFETARFTRVHLGRRIHGVLCQARIYLPNRGIVFEAMPVCAFVRVNLLSVYDHQQRLKHCACAKWNDTRRTISSRATVFCFSFSFGFRWQRGGSMVGSAIVLLPVLTNNWCTFDWYRNWIVSNHTIAM